MNPPYQIINHDCLEWLRNGSCPSIDLSFIDPPFNQGKDYRHWNDNLSEQEYWQWVAEVLAAVYDKTSHGGGGLFYAAGKKHRICSANAPKNRLDVSKFNHLEKENICRTMYQ